MNTGCETRISEELGDLTGAADPGEAYSAPDRAQESARELRDRPPPQELRPAGGHFLVHARHAGRRNHAAGESHWNARHADAVVDRARELHAAGVPIRQVARTLGLARSTARQWIVGLRRVPLRLSIMRRPLDFELPTLIGLADLPSLDSQSSTE